MRRLLALGVLALAVPGTARAATVTAERHPEYDFSGTLRQFSDLRYTAAPGEANDLVLERREDGFAFRDSAGVTAGPGCRATGDPTVAVCDGDSNAVSTFAVTLGDRADRLTGTLAATLVRAGRGDDTIELPVPGFGPDATVFGGEGADVLRTPGGVVDGGLGPDVLSGAQVTYAGRTEAVSASADGLPNDGAPGEGDTIDPSIRTIIGGRGPDRLDGTAAADRLAGGPGGDTIDGGDGRDSLDGGPGADRLDGGRGDDSVRAGDDRATDAGTGWLAGGPGRDELFGGRGPERIDGGPGQDEIYGYGGADRIASVDGALDRITCLFPPERSGRAALDDLDLARGCTGVSRTAPGAPRLLVLGLSDEDAGGVLRVGIGCSQDQRGGCRVRVRLRHRKRTVAERRQIIPAGSATLIRPRVPGRLLRHRGGCGGARVGVAIRGRDTAGRVRTIRRRFKVGSLGGPCRRPFLVITGDEAGW